MIDIGIPVALETEYRIIALLFGNTHRILEMPFEQHRTQSHICDAQVLCDIGNDECTIIGHSQVRFSTTCDAVGSSLVTCLHVEDGTGRISTTIFPHLPRTCASETGREI